ncbi:NAD-dependent epimerase/dehydratase family protein [Ascidiimonas aurantiaca]|uniref:NAD-dependent epimerase/dehydratase family protein n=1 Tax=Ascidiimonas aurantiaca TaxID=1685432 RepID=UPI0030EC51B1
MILVTGGTGLVGSHLLYRLISLGKEVVAIHRAQSDLSRVKKVFSFFSENADTLFSKIKWIEADITDIPALNTAFTGITHVYHSAAFISFDASDNKLLRKINIEGTANIVNLCIAHKVHKLCFVSSIATMGDKLFEGMVTEESHWNPEADNNSYAISKYGAEMEVWRGSVEGVKTVIVNPGVILGAGFKDGSGKIFEVVQKGMKYYTQGLTGFVDVEDVAKAMTILMDSTLTNQRYILVAENLTFKELMTRIAKEFNVRAPYLKAGPFILGVLWRSNWLWSKCTSKRPVFTRASVKAAVKKEHFSNHKIKKDLAFSFKPIYESIHTICKNFTRN